MARASYQAAIDWMADHEDTDWVDDARGILSVTAALVADLFSKDDEQVVNDLRKALSKRAR